MRIEPKSDYLVLRKPTPQEMPLVLSSGGLELPTHEIMKRLTFGVVVAAGPGFEEENGTLRPMRAKVGDVVVCQPKCGEFGVVHDGDIAIMVRDAAVAGIVISAPVVEEVSPGAPDLI